MVFSDFELGGAIASSPVKISDNVVIIKGYCCGAASHLRVSRDISSAQRSRVPWRAPPASHVEVMVAIRSSTLALIVALAVGGAAQAEAVRPAAAPRLSLAPAKALDLTAPGLPVLYSRAPTPLPPGVARTSVEGKVAGDAQLGAGLLCGLKPNADESGAGRARGYDPDGKFVGAKLAFSF
jgi:hypothetical protein